MAGSTADEDAPATGVEAEPPESATTSDRSRSTAQQVQDGSARIERVPRGLEHVIRGLLFASASAAVVVTGAIIYTLMDGTIGFFDAAGTSLTAFLGSPQWGTIGLIIVGIAASLAVADLALFVGLKLFGRFREAGSITLGEHATTGLAARTLTVASGLILHAVGHESLLPLLPRGPAWELVAPVLFAAAGLWVIAEFAGESIIPTRDAIWSRSWARVLALGGAVVVYSVALDVAGGVLGFGAIETSDIFGSVKWAGVANQFSIWSLLSGTILVAGGALAIAGPVGVGAALYLAEFASDSVRAVGKPLIELLAGVPSIVYGFFALFTISLWMQDTFGAMTYNAGSAIIVVSVMVLPIVVSLSDDAISSVPQDLRDASLAMGATEWETSVKIVLPAARSGVFASIFLGLARALGETMAVMLAAGSIARWHLDPLIEVQTMTTYIGRVSTGDIPPGPAVDAAFAVGLVLFLITYTVNWGGQLILERVGVAE